MQQINFLIFSSRHRVVFFSRLSLREKKIFLWKACLAVQLNSSGTTNPFQAFLDNLKWFPIIPWIILRFPHTIQLFMLNNIYSARCIFKQFLFQPTAIFRNLILYYYSTSFSQTKSQLHEHLSIFRARVPFLSVSILNC